MDIENTEVSGFRAALRGMRNPLNSWGKSDTLFLCGSPFPPDGPIQTHDNPVIGPSDLKLAQSLVKAGNEHAKFTRTIWVWVDLTLPRYILTELDTYRVATTRLSCSTRPSSLKKSIFSLDMFQTDGLTAEDLSVLGIVVNHLNKLNEEYEVTKNKDCLRRIKKLLPEAYLQKGTFNFNYQTLRNIFWQRKNHWLDEWEVICDWIRSLPYSKELIIGEE